MTHYSIVTFGRSTYGSARAYYTSAARAIADAKTLGGGSLTTVRVVECATRQEAINADISGGHSVVWSR